MSMSSSSFENIDSYNRTPLPTPVEKEFASFIKACRDQNISVIKGFLRSLTVPTEIIERELVSLFGQPEDARIFEPQQMLLQYLLEQKHSKELLQSQALEIFFLKCREESSYAIPTVFLQTLNETQTRRLLYVMCEKDYEELIHLLNLSRLSEQLMKTFLFHAIAKNRINMSIILINSYDFSQPTLIEAKKLALQQQKSIERIVSDDSLDVTDEELSLSPGTILSFQDSPNGPKLIEDEDFDPIIDALSAKILS